MGENGKEKLLDMARHIAKTLGHNESMADDILQIFSNFDVKFSREILTEGHAHADDMMHQAMLRFEEEFRSLMERGDTAAMNHCFDSNVEDDDSQIPVAQPLTDYNLIIDALPSPIINALHEIAKRMLAAGFGSTCSHVYITCRKEFLEESISRLQLQKLSTEEVNKMTWHELEDEIDRWIKAANVTLRILLPSERRLCDRVFFGLSDTADLSFLEVCRGVTIQLLNFADAIAKGSRSPERLFKVLDVYETMRDLIPEFDIVFRNEAVTVWRLLGEAIRGIFIELENLIRSDPAKSAVPGGGVHPITRYVMNYLRAACRSRQTLEQVFEETNGALTVQMCWIMEVLESNLEVKSKAYKDQALSSVFLMNNGRYIVHKVKDGELGLLLGEDWIRKRNAKVRQYHMSYQRTSWNKILGLLKVDTTAAGRDGLGKNMKEKLKKFNMQFDEICKVHTTWVVCDEQLREELKISLGRLLLPAYGNFIGRFQNLGDVGKDADKYIKYGVEDVEVRINDLFKGTTTSRK